MSDYNCDDNYERAMSTMFKIWLQNKRDKSNRVTSTQDTLGNAAL